MMDRANQEGDHNIEGKHPKVTGGHPPFQPRPHQRQEDVVFLPEGDRDGGRPVPCEGLLQEKGRRPGVLDQPSQVALDGLSYAPLRRWVGGEKKAGAALILVEKGVVKCGDQLILGPEVVVEGAYAYRRPLADLLHETARLTDFEHGFESRVEDVPTPLTGPQPPVGHGRH